ncbi:hypothetical protein PLESTM_001886400 [Pleodorina starrii]|nr:hypothetical protein PLESTM_001886400 [Pleodorina starrii]
MTPQLDLTKADAVKKQYVDFDGEGSLWDFLVDLCANMELCGMKVEFLGGGSRSAGKVPSPSRVINSSPVLEEVPVAMLETITSVQLTELPEALMLQVFKRLPQEDIKSLRLACSRLCNLCNKASRLSGLKASALLLTDAAPTLTRIPPVSILDFNARNAACGHQLLAALRQHGSRLEDSVRSVRLSGRDGLLAALQTLRLACPRVERLEIRCQHGYRGRHKECADLGRCLQELEAAFPALTELHLQRFPISSAQLVHLCDSLLSLRALSIRGLAHALTGDSLAHLHRLSALVSLSVDHLKLQGGSLPCGTQLRSLELSDATISAASFASLNSLAGLQSLSVWGTGHRSALAFAPLTGLTALRRLHLELTLDVEVLQGLGGCTALANLSAPGARVLLPVAAAAAAAAADGVRLPPQLTSVTRLSLESWSEDDCLPLAAWLPRLRSLALEDGVGMWAAVAGHEQLTALRADGGGCLPPAAAAEPAADGRSLEPSCGVEACRAARCGSHHHHHHHHHHHEHRQTHSGHHLGLGECRSDDSGGFGSIHGGGGSGSDGSSGSISSSGGDGPGGRSSCGSGGGGDGGGTTSSGSGGRGAAGVRDGDGDGATPCAVACRASSSGGAQSGSEAEAGEAARELPACAGASAAGAAPQPPPQLASLRLGGCQDLPEQHYLSCAPLPSLTSCTLSGCGTLTTAALGRLLSGMPALQELALEGAPYLTDQALAGLGSGARALRGGGGGGNDGCGAAGESLRAGVDGGGDVCVAEEAGTAPLPVVACSPAVAAATRAAATATDVPVPPCSACAGVAEAEAPLLGAAAAAAVAFAPLGPTLPANEFPSRLRTAPVAGPGGFHRSSSAAALTAAAAMEGFQEAPAAMAAADAGGGAAAALRRLELTGLPGITARGVAAAAAGLPRLMELRVSSCQAVCREACVWLPQQLGRPWLSVVCSHAAVYDDH